MNSMSSQRVRTIWIINGWTFIPNEIDRKFQNEKNIPKDIHLVKELELPRIVI